MAINGSIQDVCNHFRIKDWQLRRARTKQPELRQAIIEAKQIHRGDFGTHLPLNKVSLEEIKRLGIKKEKVDREWMLAKFRLHFQEKRDRENRKMLANMDEYHYGN